jgi:hypothetical protein
MTRYLRAIATIAPLVVGALLWAALIAVLLALAGCLNDRTLPTAPKGDGFVYGSCESQVAAWSATLGTPSGKVQTDSARVDWLYLPPNGHHQALDFNPEGGSCVITLANLSF